MATNDPRLTTRSYRALRAWVLDRDNHRCQIKGPRCTTVATTVDHIEPRAEGGAVVDPANMRAACVPCNARGGAEMTNTRRYRDSVARYVTRF